MPATVGGPHPLLCEAVRTGCILLKIGTFPFHRSERGALVQWALRWWQCEPPPWTLLARRHQPSSQCVEHQNEVTASSAVCCRAAAAATAAASNTALCWNSSSDMMKSCRCVSASLSPPPQALEWRSIWACALLGCARPLYPPTLPNISSHLAPNDAIWHFFMPIRD